MRATTFWMAAALGVACGYAITRSFADGSGESGIKALLNDVGEFLDSLGIPDPGGGCFPATAPILTPSGYRPLRSLQERDHVVSYDPDSGELAARQITRRIVHRPEQILTIRTADGRDVDTTAHHSFLTTRGYVRLTELRASDSLVSIRGNEVSSLFNG